MQDAVEDATISESTTKPAEPIELDTNETEKLREDDNVSSASSSEHKLKIDIEDEPEPKVVKEKEVIYFKLKNKKKFYSNLN